MSGVDIYTFDLDGNATYYKTAKNAWGFAMHVWDTLAQKYGVSYSLFASMSNPDLLKPLWNIAYRTDASRQDRIMMSLTYDKTWIKLEHLIEVIEAVKAFYQKHPTDTLAELLTFLMEADLKVISGVGLHANSISCDYWNPVTTKKGKERPFNLYKDLEDHAEIMDVFLYKSTDEHDAAKKQKVADKQVQKALKKQKKKAKKEKKKKEKKVKK